EGAPEDLVLENLHGISKVITFAKEIDVEYFVA
ncbi:hypothetical protein LCGC14_1280110, partial [marine sediment metagenome]